MKKIKPIYVLGTAVLLMAGLTACALTDGQTLADVNPNFAQEETAQDDILFGTEVADSQTEVTEFPSEEDKQEVTEIKEQTVKEEAPAEPEKEPEEQPEEKPEEKPEETPEPVETPSDTASGNDSVSGNSVSGNGSVSAN